MDMGIDLARQYDLVADIKVVLVVEMGIVTLPGPLDADVDGDEFAGRARDLQRARHALRRGVWVEDDSRRDYHALVQHPRLVVALVVGLQKD